MKKKKKSYEQNTTQQCIQSINSLNTTVKRELPILQYNLLTKREKLQDYLNIIDTACTI